MHKQMKVKLMVAQCPFCHKFYVEKLWEKPCKHMQKDYMKKIGRDMVPTFVIVFKKGDEEIEVRPEYKQCRLHVPIN